MSVLLFDWGIGGLSVWRVLRALRPDLELVYVSDSGFTPYGKVPPEELAQRMSWLVGTMREVHDIDTVVVACNAASAALPLVAEGARWIGMIEAGVALVRESRAERVGVIGGNGTVASGVFQSRLGDLDLQVQSAQPLSALVEAGELTGPSVEDAVEGVLAELAPMNALLLACTHYPALAPIIAARLPGVRLLDPADRVAREVASTAPRSPRSGEWFYTTGNVYRTTTAAQLGFGVRWEPSPWPGPGH